MRVYQFSEQPYYPTWNDHSGSLRVILPNRKCDPRVAADLFHRYYDEYQACDDVECYLPETVPVKWTLHVQPLDRTRVPENLRRQAPPPSP